MKSSGSNIKRGRAREFIPFADLYYVGLHKTASTFVYRQIFPTFGGRLVAASKFPQSAERGTRPSGVLLFDRNDSISGAIDGVDLSGAQKIAAVNPQGKILITIRSQYSALRSMYGLSVKLGDTRTFSSFARALVEGRKLDYHDLVENYRAVFGQDHVLVLLFEELTEATPLAVEKLSVFLGLPMPDIKSAAGHERPSPGDLVIATRWLANYMFRSAPVSIQNPIRNVAIGSSYLAERVVRVLSGRPVKLFSLGRSELELMEAFAESNRRLFATLPASQFAERYPGMASSPSGA